MRKAVKTDEKGSENLTHSRAAEQRDLREGTGIVEQQRVDEGGAHAGVGAGQHRGVVEPTHACPLFNRGVMCRGSAGMFQEGERARARERRARSEKREREARARERCESESEGDLNCRRTGRPHQTQPSAQKKPGRTPYGRGNRCSIQLLARRRGRRRRPGQRG